MAQTPASLERPTPGLAEDLAALSAAAQRRKALAAELQSPDSPACVLRDRREAWRAVERICAVSGLGVDDLVEFTTRLLLRGNL